jgi:hypothetical protein
MDVEGGIGSRNFLDLDPIPEDISVAAAESTTSQHAVKLSAPSVMASSDDSGNITITRDNTSTGTNKSYKINNGGGKSKRRGGGSGSRRRQRGGGGGGDEEEIIVSEAAGAEAAGDDDNVSDANASLFGGVTDQEPEGPFSSPSSKKNTDNITMKSFFTALSNCTTRSIIFLGIILLLFIGIGVGMFFIVQRIVNAEEGLDSSFSSSAITSSPSMLSPLEPSSSKPFPFPAPIALTEDGSVAVPTSSSSSFTIYSQDEIDALDDAFLKVHGTDDENLYDKNTPEGKGRDWIIYSDQIKLNIDDGIGEELAQQRYILCVFYYATNGDYWNTKNWLNAELSECEWNGINCTDTNIVRSITLPDKNITGPIQKEIQSLSQLEYLNLVNNSISSSIPEDFFDLMDEMAWLKLEDNQLTGIIPQKSTGTSKLVYLKVGTNQLEGEVPFFPNAKKMWFYNNSITSFDPRYTTEALDLVEFRGFNNKLSGPLPAQWNGPNLTKLDLGYNVYTGSIPQYIWDMPVLKHLYFDHTNFTGTLPSSSSSTRLGHVWLDNNELTGTIPSNFGWNWTHLHELKLQENSLTGNITLDQCNRWKVPKDFFECSNSSDFAEDSDVDWIMNTDCDIDCDCCNNCYCALTDGDGNNADTNNRRRR